MIATIPSLRTPEEVRREFEGLQAMDPGEFRAYLNRAPTPARPPRRIWSLLCAASSGAALGFFIAWQLLRASH
jgi:hypothetical protein